MYSGPYSLVPSGTTLRTGAWRVKEVSEASRTGLLLQPSFPEFQEESVRLYSPLLTMFTSATGTCGHCPQPVLVIPNPLAITSVFHSWIPWLFPTIPTIIIAGFLLDQTFLFLSTHLLLTTLMKRLLQSLFYTCRKWSPERVLISQVTSQVTRLGVEPGSLYFGTSGPLCSGGLSMCSSYGLSGMITQHWGEKKSHRRVQCGPKPRSGLLILYVLEQGWLD